jgi:hypothetical protein
MGFTPSPDRLVVRIRFGLPVLALAVLLVKVVIRWPVSYAIGFGVVGGLFVLELLALYGLFRLSADATGIRVANGFPTRIPWAQVESIAVTQKWVNGITVRRLQITRTDGRVIRPLVPKASFYSGYSNGDLDRIVQRLLAMRRHALRGADSPELTEALAAAASGNPVPIDHLLATHGIEPEEYSERLHELADRGQVDLEALRRARRKQR